MLPLVLQLLFHQEIQKHLMNLDYPGHLMLLVHHQFPQDLVVQQDPEVRVNQMHQQDPVDLEDPLRLRPLHHQEHLLGLLGLQVL